MSALVQTALTEHSRTSHIPPTHLTIDEYLTNPDPHTDELPDYEHEEAPPSYLVSPNSTQEVTYKLKQWDRSSQRLIPLSATSDRAPLIITTKTRAKLFSSPPDIHFQLENADAELVEPAAPASVTIRFDEGARTLPWFPKATLKVMGGDGVLLHKQILSCTDFVNWNVRLDDADFCWGVTLNPNALVLMNKRTEAKMGRFVYSEVGTHARRGDYVGELTFNEEDDGANQAGLKRLLIAVSCFVTVIYWRRLGRNYKNSGCMAGGREVTLTSPH